MKAAAINPKVPPTHPKGTITIPEWPNAYALLSDVTRTRPTWYHGSATISILLFILL